MSSETTKMNKLTVASRASGISVSNLTQNLSAIINSNDITAGNIAYVKNDTTVSGFHPFTAIQTVTIENKLYNCPNCGAPVTGDTCEYCGTIFRWR